MVGFARRPLLAAAVAAVPVMVVTAWSIVRWQAPTLIKYLLLLAVMSFAATLAPYELLIRRFRVPRFLFSMKGQRAS